MTDITKCIGILVLMCEWHLNNKNTESQCLCEQQKLCNYQKSVQQFYSNLSSIYEVAFVWTKREINTCKHVEVRKHNHTFLTKMTSLLLTVCSNSCVTLNVFLCCTASSLFLYVIVLVGCSWLLCSVSLLFQHYVHELRLCS